MQSLPPRECSSQVQHITSGYLYLFLFEYPIRTATSVDDARWANGSRQMLDLMLRRCPPQMARIVTWNPHVGTQISTRFANMNNTDLVSPYGPFFRRLPMELRILVWIDVLASSADIANAHKFMRPREPLIVTHFPPIKDIDAALLRTCRAIYGETFPILYGNNRFVFFRASQIPKFAFGKLYFPLRRHILDSPFGHALKCNVRILAADITGVAGCISQSLTPTIPLQKNPPH